MNQQLKQIPIEEFSRCLAPWIIEQDFVKQVVSLQMFANPIAKEKLHILICGSVSVAKSDLLLEVTDIAPNSAFTSKKITPQGMVEKLFATSGGMIMIDEMDKIGKEVREQLLEFMQSQKITSDKFRYHVSADVYTNVLASCNPIGAILNESMPIYAQVNFGLPVISRFHLFMPMHTLPPERYRDISISHEMDMDKYRMVKKKLTEHIIMVRQSIPLVSMSEGMASAVGDYIARLKRTSIYAEIITPRTIEGFKSCMKANARMNLRSVTKDEDFEFVKEVFDKLYYK